MSQIGTDEKEKLVEFDETSRRKEINDLLFRIHFIPPTTFDIYYLPITGRWAPQTNLGAKEGNKKDPR